MTVPSLDSALKILAKLVAFPTISDQSNLDLMHYVQSYLDSYDVENHLIPADPAVATNLDTGKANLWAVIGSKYQAGIALSGHSDVVPVLAQNWTRDPFTLHVTTDKAYGRGSCDMKGFLACSLAMVPYFKSLNLVKPIFLYFSYDEEVGCRGIKHLIARLGKDFPKPEIIIVGEPSEMKTLSAHKSLLACTTKITGFAGHSSKIHEGVSATMIAARLISQIDAMLKFNQANPAKIPFNPPYTSLHVGKMQGGTALNIIANYAEFIWDIRAIPSDDPNEYLKKLTLWAQKTLLPEMHKISSECTITTKIAHYLPAFQHQEDSLAEKLVRELSGDNSLNFASYMAEAGLFQQAGFPTLIYGPGSIDQAHKADEWISLQQMQQCLNFLGLLGRKLNTG